MKRLSYHIILILLFFASCKKETDWTYTLDKNSTEPFGLYLAYDQLNDIFPLAKKKTIYDLSESISESNSASYFSDRNKLLISISSRMYLSNQEINELHTYVENGGNVLMLSQYYSLNFDTLFNFKAVDHEAKYPYTKKDSITIFKNEWQDKWYQTTIDWQFPKNYLEADSGEVIARKKVEDKEETVIVKRFIGDGQLIIGTCPEMLTNFAMLKGNNPQFYEQLFSNFKKSTYTVNWFSDFSVYPDRESRKSNLMKLLQEKSYRYAFLVMLLMAALFFLFETRRRQRLVQVVPPVSNDSLAFTEAIGKLYYGKKDNLNLAGKMIQYYLEHVRTVYGIPTTYLNKEFGDKLARKLSKPNEEVHQFVTYLNLQLTSSFLSEEDIKKLYKTLKKYN